MALFFLRLFIICKPFIYLRFIWIEFVKVIFNFFCCFRYIPVFLFNVRSNRLSILSGYSIYLSTIILLFEINISNLSILI